MSGRILYSEVDPTPRDPSRSHDPTLSYPTPPYRTLLIGTTAVRIGVVGLTIASHHKFSHINKVDDCHYVAVIWHSNSNKVDDCHYVAVIWHSNINKVDDCHYVAVIWHSNINKVDDCHYCHKVDDCHYCRSNLTFNVIHSSHLTDSFLSKSHVIVLT